MSAVFAAARADFLHRVRSYRFLVVLAATIALGLLMLPTPEAGYEVLEVADARGAYGAAWVGLVFGVIGATVLPLFGFFVVKDALARDRSTRVGQLLAASPLSKTAYLSAKFASNVAVFVAILAVSTVVAFVMQWWRAEDRAFHPLDLIVHLWAPALPVALWTSAVALLFECVPGLRTAAGNVVFFFLWAGVLIPGLQSGIDTEGRTLRASVDFAGISAPLADFDARLGAQRPQRTSGLTIGANIREAPVDVVPWPGIAGDAGWLLERLLWCLSCLPFLGLALVFFDRFDPARGRRGGAAAANDAATADAAAMVARWHKLTPLAQTSRGWHALTLLTGELRLLLKRRAWWWYAGAGGLLIAGAANTPAHGLNYIAPLAWLWALTLYSELGARAELNRTQALLNSAPSPLLRQLPLQWIAGTVCGLVLAATVALRLVLAGDVSGLLQLAVGAAFVPALALALGALSGGARLFELVFLMLSYGLLENVPHSRYAGVAATTFGASDAPVYFMLALVLVAATAGLRNLAQRR